MINASGAGVAPAKPRPDGDRGFVGGRTADSGVTASRTAVVDVVVPAARTGRRDATAGAPTGAGGSAG